MSTVKKIIYRQSTKAVVFIDAANVIYSQKSLKWQIDFKKLMNYFKNNYQLDNVHFYFAYIKDDKKQQGFFDKLRQWGYKIRTKEVKLIRQTDGTISKKGNLDVELTIDAVKSIKFYSTAILMSGDSDFHALIRYLQSKNKKVVVISSKGHVSYELLKAANKYINFNNLREFVERI
ncbi:NYN domain-containing protein [Candidatus Daviesbacteria bacterium]|nr:NYN domain-containing protein [Candidatus Daviesbacteria bacterium]